MYSNHNGNQRESGTPYMRNATKTQFERTMKREGRIVTTYTGGAAFHAFFRTRDEHENQKESVIMYYDVNAPVRPGTLVMVGYGVFLALNRETTENDVYYKSVLIKCNGTFNENSGKVHSIPFYSENLKSSISIGNNVISTLNGNIEFITEENSLSKQIEINQRFNEFGRTFKVCNKYSMDGIAHIICEIYADSKVDFIYSVQINDRPDMPVSPDTVVQLKAMPYINGNATVGVAIYEWESSDSSVATVDSRGKVTCISEGEAQITVTWLEKNVSETIDITVVNADAPVIPDSTYTCTISGNTNLKNGYRRTYTVTFTDKDGNVMDWQEIDYQWNVLADFEVKQTITDNKLTVSVGNEELVGQQFLIQILIADKVKAEITVRIVE